MALTFSALIVLLIVLFGTLSVRRFLAYSEREMRTTEGLLRDSLAEKSLSLVAALALTSEQALAENNFGYLLDVVRVTVAQDDDVAYGLIADPDGVVLVHSDPGRRGSRVEAAPGPLLRRSGVAAAYAVPDAPGREAVVEVVSPIGSGTQQLGSLRFGIRLARLQREVAEAEARQREELRRVLATWAVVTLACVLLGLASAVAVSARITRPLARLTQRARTIGEGELAGAVPALPRHDEVGVLGETLEGMRRSLQALLAEQAALAADARRRAAEWEHVLAAITDAVWVFDAEGRTVFANAAAASLLCTGRGQLEGRSVPAYAELVSVFDLDDGAVPPERWPAVRTHVEQGLREGTFRLEVRGASDARFVRIGAAPVAEAGVVVVASDITEQVRFSRMKDEFMAVVAHELKTPVAVMKGHAQLLERIGEPLSPRVKSSMAAINRGADRIDRIVRDLLDVARLNLGGISLSGTDVFELSGLVGEVVEDVSRTTTQHPLRVVAAEPAEVQGNRPRVEQVLVNLLTNAIKYSPPGAPVEVSTTAAPGEVVVAVRDHGIGIPRDKLGRVFERFYRAHSGTPHDQGGMGVGLYLSREIVEAHGGRIEVESVEGQGSTFRVTLPRRRSADA